MWWLIVSLALASTEFQSVEVYVYLNKDLTINVEEKYKLLIYDIDKYIELAGSPNTTIADWREFINDSRFVYHISGDGIIRENIRVEATQIYLRNYNSGFADIILKYKIKPTDNKGLFKIIERTPRKEILALDPLYLTFTRTGNNYILISNKESIVFEFDPSFSVIEISPASNIEENKYIWTNTVLNNPTIILKKSVSYDELILEGTKKLYDNLVSLLSIPVVLLYIFLTVFFLILTNKVVFYDK